MSCRSGQAGSVHHLRPRFDGMSLEELTADVARRPHHIRKSDGT
jgi:hypothetical protein